jgi:hypothetical protein
VSSAIGSPSAADEPAPALAPGIRVRVRTAADLPVEIPGVAIIDRQFAKGDKLLTDDETHTVSVRDGRTDARLTLPQPGAAFVGEVVALGEETMLIRLDGKPMEVTIPRTVIDEMAVSRGQIKRRTRGKSALAGLALGGVGGFLLGRISGDDHCTPPPGSNFFQAIGSCLYVMSATEKGVYLGTILGVVGGITGLASGGGMKDNWESVPSPRSSRVQISLRPLAHAGLSARITF